MLRRTFCKQRRTLGKWTPQTIIHTTNNAPLRRQHTPQVINTPARPIWSLERRSKYRHLMVKYSSRLYIYIYIPEVRKLTRARALKQKPYSTNTQNKRSAYTHARSGSSLSTLRATPNIWRRKMKRKKIGYAPHPRGLFPRFQSTHTLGGKNSDVRVVDLFGELTRAGKSRGLGRSFAVMSLEQEGCVSSGRRPFVVVRYISVQLLAPLSRS